MRTLRKKKAEIEEGGRRERERAVSDETLVFDL